MLKSVFFERVGPVYPNSLPLSPSPGPALSGDGILREMKTDGQIRFRGQRSVATEASRPWIFPALRASRLAVGLVIEIAVAAVGKADAPPPWDPVSPAELATAQSPTYPDAPAEIVFWRIEIDERNYPRSRRINESIRYKIYDPAKATSITRITGVVVSSDGTIGGVKTIRAHLVLPDGTSKEFGQDDVQERTVSKSGDEESWVTRLLGSKGTEVKERFLATPGLKSGAILDVQLTELQEPAFNGTVSTLQKELIPIRELTLTQRLSDSSDFNPQSILVNDKGLQVDWKEDAKKNVVETTAHNLPALVNEPFSAPISDRALTIFGSYSLRTFNFRARNRTDYFEIDPKAGPWARPATLYYMLDADATDPTRAVKALALKIIGDATTETEKARRIHRYVADTYQRYLHSHRANIIRRYNSVPLDEVAEFEDYPNVSIIGIDFLWLDLGLFRAAGFEAHAVLLPNRRLMRFNPQLFSEMFLNNIAARVRADGAWQFSLPTTEDDLPFGELPWPFQSSMGLIAQANKVEFVRIPSFPAAASTIETKGEFTLGTDGGLSGHAQRRFTGMPAINLRTQLRKMSAQERRDAIDKNLKSEFPIATAVVGELKGVDDIDVPLTFDFDLTWDDYAVATKKRMIFRPSVFHGTSLSPFSAETRHNLVDFPYHWREIDDVSIQMPAGYQFESPSAPRSFPRADLNYQVDLGYAPETRELHLRRDFASELTYVQPANYPLLRGMYANVARSDAQELVLTKSGPSPRPVAETPPPVPAGFVPHP